MATFTLSWVCGQGSVQHTRIHVEEKGSLCFVVFDSGKHTCRTIKTWKEILPILAEDIKVPAHTFEPISDLHYKDLFADGYMEFFKDVPLSTDYSFLKRIDDDPQIFGYKI